MNIDQIREIFGVRDLAELCGRRCIVECFPAGPPYHATLLGFARDDHLGCACDEYDEYEACVRIDSDWRVRLVHLSRVVLEQAP